MTYYKQVNLSTKYNQNKMADQNNTMSLLRQGTKDLAKEYEQNREAQKVLNIKMNGADSGEDNGANGAGNVDNMTSEQKIELLTKAVADLTLKMNGGNTDGE